MQKGKVPTPSWAQKSAHHEESGHAVAGSPGVNGCGLPENTLEYFRFIFSDGVPSPSLTLPIRWLVSFS